MPYLTKNTGVYHVFDVTVLFMRLLVCFVAVSMKYQAAYQDDTADNIGVGEERDCAPGKDYTQYSNND